MPTSSAPDEPQTLGQCKRCSTNAAVLKIRQENLCFDCFSRYLTTKIVKKMEAFRVRNLAPGKTRRLLLPLSLGLSSAVLLHVLSEHRNGQLSKSGRPGYELQVVHVETASSIASSRDRVDAFKRRYPQHDFAIVPLSDGSTAHAATDLGSPVADSLDAAASPVTKSDAMQRDSQNGEDSQLGLTQLLSSLTSATSRRDREGILLRNRIVDEAKRLECEGILWGDTTTSLAEKVLAETAKGRGFSLPWLTNDGESPLGVPFYFPMKDLLRKELPPFADAVGITPDLVDTGTLAATAPASAKNATIDGLMKEYFETVEENYPSIVANVVRTSSKLQAPEIETISRTCDLCRLPLDDASTLQQLPDSKQFGDASNITKSLSSLCHGCTQAVFGPA